MALKHDAQGFLVGTPIEKELILPLWSQIRDDVRAIRESLRGPAPSRSYERSSRPGGNGAHVTRTRSTYVAEPSARGRATGAANSLAIARRENKTTPSPKPFVRRAEIAAPTGRDASGRFVAKHKEGGVGGGPEPSGGGGYDSDIRESTVKSLVGRLSSAALNSAGGLEEADPAVKAFQEVAQPMARGYELLTGGSEDKKQTGFLRRIFTKMNLFHKEETALQKASAKTLKAIEGKPEGGGGESGGVIGRLLAGLVSSIPLLATALAGLKAALSFMKSAGGNLLGAAKGGGLLAGIKGLGKGALGGIKGLGGGFLKRIPLLGTLLGGALAWGEAEAADGDSSLSGDERRGKKGKAWGGLAGGALGAVIGSFLLPGVGTIVGGLVGDWLGGVFGESIGGKWSAMTESIVGIWSTCTTSISSAWDSCTAFFTESWAGITKKWDGFVDWAQGKWENFTGLFARIYEAMKDLPVIGPAIKAAETAASKAAELASGAKDKVVEAAGNIKDKAVELAVSAKNKTISALSSGADYLANNTLVGRGVKSLASMIAGGESGKAGYNAYNRGTGLAANGARDISGMTLDEIAVAQKLKRDNPNRLMAVGKYQMMPSTLAEGAKALGLRGDTKFTPEIQERLYADYLVGKKRPDIRNYITGDSQDASRAQIAMAQEWRSIADPRTGKTYADKGAAGNKASVSADSALNSLNAARSQYRANLASGMPSADAYRFAVTQIPTVMASAKSPSLPAMPSAPAVSESPPVIDPMASTGGRAITVSAQSPEVGQDVSDRRIAHIQTGGIS